VGKKRWPRRDLGVGFQLVAHLEAVFFLAIDPPNEEVAAIGGPGDTFLAFVLARDQGLNEGTAEGLASQRRDALLLEPQSVPASHFKLLGDGLRTFFLVGPFFLVGGLRCLALNQAKLLGRVGGRFKPVGEDQSVGAGNVDPHIAERRPGARRARNRLLPEQFALVPIEHEQV